MPQVVNQEYAEKIEEAITTAIFDVGKQYGGGTLILLSGEIISACLMVLSFAASTSKETATAAGTRRFSEWCAKRIRTRVRMFQEEMDKAPINMHVVHADERH
jgi:hypothetical protein